MESKVEKKRAFLINFAFLALILGLIYCFFRYLFWATAPFLLSFFFAVLMQKPLRWLDRKTKNKCHTLWSVLLVLLSISIILLPLIFIFAEIVSQIINFVGYLGEQLSDLPQFMETLQSEILKFLSFLPESIYESVSDKIITAISGIVNDFDFSKLGLNIGTITSSVTGMFSVFKNVPSAVIGIVVGIVAWIFFTKDYSKIVKFIRLQLPDGKKNLLVEIKQVFSNTIFKMMRAYGLIMFITFCELFIGLSVLNFIGVMNNSYIFIIAIAIAVFDILPVAGSGGILIPWAVISLVTGDFGRAVGIIVIYAVITVIRQYIEPKIVGTSLGVNPILTLAGLYFGLKLFGFMGMFIVPILLMTVKAFNDTGRIHLWKNLED